MRKRQEHRGRGRSCVRGLGLGQMPGWPGPDDMITVSCEDCGDSRLMRFADVDELQRRFPTGAGACPVCSA